MNRLEQFIHLYPVSKTLRFELKPVGKTAKNFENSGLLEQDKHRDESYRKVKKIIDRYHKSYIDSAFSSIDNTDIKAQMLRSLHDFVELYKESKRTEDNEKELDEIRTTLRKQIEKVLTGRTNEEAQKVYSNLFKEEMIKSTLPLFVETQEDRDLLAEFKGFTTYFMGFYENRKNIYSSEPQSTAIAYRIVHENLPKFLDNIQVYYKIKEPLSKEIATIYEQLSSEGYLNVRSLDEIFSVDYFIQVLSQNGIEVYNAIIGKIVSEEKTEIKGLNERINLYNQKNSKEHRLPLFRPLFKQILSDREQLSWLPEVFEKDNDLLRALKDFYDEISKDIFDRIRVLLQSIKDYDLSRIYIKNDPQLTEISKKLFGDWNAINIARERAYDLLSKSKDKESINYQEKRNNALKKEKSLSIAVLDECIALLTEANNKCIETYLSKIGAIENQSGSTTDLIREIQLAYRKIDSLLSNPYHTDSGLIHDKANIALIKEFLDTILNLQRFLKPLGGTGEEPDKDEKFYGEYNYVCDAIDAIIPLYNKVRNYLTQKRYRTKKIKLNFGNAQLLNGWDRNKEKDYLTVLLRKEGNYFLAIMDKKHNKSFDDSKLPEDKPCYEKMDYKLLPKAYASFPKVFLSKKGIKKFKPSQELLDKYALGTHKLGVNFNKNDLHALIDFFKQSISIHEDWSQFGFAFSETSSYQDISGFYREVEEQGFKISFRKVSESYINTLVEEGKLYLFQIYNKDFSSYSKGTPNMHTLYWKMLFDERNLADIVYKLNGQAEVFFREKSLKYDYPTHPARQPIKKKNTLGQGEESLFEYDLIKDKRYTVDKFQFHVPITMNFKNKNGDKVNTMVEDVIRENQDIHVIGIDRGERHLLYISVIDRHGNIVEQFSLNEIVNHHNDTEYKTNYHDLLEMRDAQRQNERKNWQTIEGIKDLKQGYLSQVIYRVTQLMVKYNAIVVLEDLNMGFKRGRQKVESAVYQQFEKQLIEKLNYLVDKKLDACEAGGLLRAYQLTSPFKSFREMGRQNGFLFYVPAWNTSKIDPVTGFVNLFDTRYESVTKAKSFFGKFESISFNPSMSWFEFKFDYSHFTNKAEGSRTHWTLCTYGSRIMTYRNPDKNNQRDYKNINLTSEFKMFFDLHSVDYTSTLDLKDAILRQNSKEFFSQLLELFRLIVQMRNSRKETSEDYLISPVQDETGAFYDSRSAEQNLPDNADANGAYNIALKGLWAMDQIRKAESGKKVKLAISNQQWLNFVQKKPYRND